MISFIHDRKPSSTIGDSGSLLVRSWGKNSCSRQDLSANIAISRLEVGCSLRGMSFIVVAIDASNECLQDLT